MDRDERFYYGLKYRQIKWPESVPMPKELAVLIRARLNAFISKEKSTPLTAIQIERIKQREINYPAYKEFRIKRGLEVYSNELTPDQEGKEAPSHEEIA